MTDEDHRWPEEDWLHSQPVIISAGVAAVLLLCLLIYAVVRVSDSSVEPPTLPSYPATSSETSTSTSLKTVTSTTSYSVSSVQTSEPDAPTVQAPPPEPPPPSDETTEETTEESTIPNPYVTTTTDRAGSI